MGAMLQLIEMLGDTVRRRVDSTMYEWMRQISLIADNISGGTQAQTRYVDKGGNDATGDGSFDNPFLTIQAAITSITDATVTKPYTVSVAAGVYTTSFLLAPYIYVVGANQLACILNPVTANWITAAFAAGTQDTGISNFTLQSALTIDFSLVASAGAATCKLTQLLLSTGSSITVKGNNVGNAAFVDDVESIAAATNVTFTNLGQVVSNGLNTRIGTLALNGTDAYLQSYRFGPTSVGNTITLTWTGATVGNALAVTYYGTGGNPSAITISGLGATLAAPALITLVTVPDADTTYGFGNTNPAGSVLLPNAGFISANIIATADRTISFAAAQTGTRFKLKNDSLFFITLAFTVAGGNPNGQTYIGPNGSVDMFYQGGVGWQCDNPIQSGTVALTNGVSALIPADVTAQSAITASLKTFSGAAGVIGALAADRVVGTRAGGGGFKLTSYVLATGAVVATDQGTYDWRVSRP
jgi:hypothetical protein